MGDRPVVHLGALLLAVVDDIEPRAFLETKRVEAGPALNLRFLLFGEASAAEQLEESRVIGYLELLAP